MNEDNVDARNMLLLRKWDTQENSTVTSSLARERPSMMQKKRHSFMQMSFIILLPPAVVILVSLSLSSEQSMEDWEVTAILTSPTSGSCKMRGRNWQQRREMDGCLGWQQRREMAGCLGWQKSLKKWEIESGFWSVKRTSQKENWTMEIFSIASARIERSCAGAVGGMEVDIGLEPLIDVTD